MCGGEETRGRGVGPRDQGLRGSGGGGLRERPWWQGWGPCRVSAGRQAVNPPPLAYRAPTLVGAAGRPRLGGGGGLGEAGFESPLSVPQIQSGVSDRWGRLPSNPAPGVPLVQACRVPCTGLGPPGCCWATGIVRWRQSPSGPPSYGRAGGRGPRCSRTALTVPGSCSSVQPGWRGKVVTGGVCHRHARWPSAAQEASFVVPTCALRHRDPKNRRRRTGARGSWKPWVL